MSRTLKTVVASLVLSFSAAGFAQAKSDKTDFPQSPASGSNGTTGYGGNAKERDPGLHIQGQENATSGTTKTGAPGPTKKQNKAPAKAKKESQ